MFAGAEILTAEALPGELQPAASDHPGSRPFLLEAVRGADSDMPGALESINSR
jgi:hypothetical protein